MGDTIIGLYYYNARYYDPVTTRFTQPDTIIPNPTNPQDLNRYTYVNNNPINFSDPTGHVCYSSGPNKGRCYDGADGEGSALTREEEVATVWISNSETYDPNGNVAPSTNVRYSEYGSLSGQDIIDSMRGSASSGDRTGADLRGFRVEQLTLDRDNSRGHVGIVTWASIGRAVRDNRSLLIGIASAASCAGTIGATCIVLTAAAWGVRSEQRDGLGLSRADVADGILTLATLGAVKAPASLGANPAAYPNEILGPPAVANLSQQLITSGSASLPSVILPSACAAGYNSAYCAGG